MIEPNDLSELIAMVTCTLGAFIMITVLLWLGTQNDLPNGEGF